MQQSFKLLEFNVYDENKIEDEENIYIDNKEFIVQMFGLNQKGETSSIFVTGFKPFFYIKVDDLLYKSR
jgi:hypothetical protein